MPSASSGNAVTTYGSDVQDHLTSVTDAEGNITTYVYSDRDLMTRQVSPVSGTSISTYNEHGELATETDARNIATTRTTDVLDRVTAVSYPDPTLNTTYTYDVGTFGKGRLTGIPRHRLPLQGGFRKRRERWLLRGIRLLWILGLQEDLRRVFGHTHQGKP